jgi:hypothetical protein
VGWSVARKPKRRASLFERAAIPRLGRQLTLLLFLPSTVYSVLLLYIPTVVFRLSLYTQDYSALQRPTLATMAPSVSYAKTTLPFPIFAAEFDPYNRGYLVVAGGGGEGRSGVPNQIVSTAVCVQPAHVNCV